MSLDTTGLGDTVATSAGYHRDDAERAFVRGHGVIEVHGPDGELKQSVEFTNLITAVGEQRYAEAGALGTGATVAQPTGMQLGTGTTAPAKTGAGSSIGTLVSNSLVALNGTPTSSVPSTVRRITYVCNWAAGTATANGIAEVALVNQSIGTQTVAPSSSTIARALLSPAVNKGAADSLTVTWHHDLGTVS
jgi:hypothetical protein